MRVYTFRTGNGPWIPLLMLILVLLMLPLLGGFFLLAAGAAVIGSFLMSFRRKTPHLNKAETARMVVLDEHHNVLRTEE